MTTAARPNWLPAVGGNRISDSKSIKMHLKRGRDLASHTTLKTRAPESIDGQAAASEQSTTASIQGSGLLLLDKAARKAALKKRLEEAEAAHFAAKNSGGSLASGIPSHATGPVALAIVGTVSSPSHSLSLNGAEEGFNTNPPGQDGYSSSDSSSEGESEDSNSEDEDDDTAQLMRELEKIKQERAAEKQRADEKAMEEEERLREEAAIAGNPLLAPSSTTTSFAVKRRWDEDVIFKNQAKGTTAPPPKRFINDMLRSDFHRKFMGKYMK